MVVLQSGGIGWTGSDRFRLNLSEPVQTCPSGTELWTILNLTTTFILRSTFYRLHVPVGRCKVSYHATSDKSDEDEPLPPLPCSRLRRFFSAFRARLASLSRLPPVLVALLLRLPSLSRLCERFSFLCFSSFSRLRFRDFSCL